MIISDRIRAMSDGQRIRFYLAQVLSDGITNSRRHELLDEVNKVLKGRKLTDPIPDLNLDISYPVRTNPNDPVRPPVVTFEWDGKTYTNMELAILDRKDFIGANPEPTARPIQSFLTDAEKEELKGEQ